MTAARARDVSNGASTIVSVGTAVSVIKVVGDDDRRMKYGAALYD